VAEEVEDGWERRGGAAGGRREEAGGAAVLGGGEGDVTDAEAAAAQVPSEGKGPRHTATLHMLYTHVYTHEDCVYTL
jgi:hypothetical protein